MTRMIFEKIRGPETTRLTVEPVGPAPVEKME